ncbi:recombinase family protein [Lentzea sp. CA-135723]|uniref:recombinase family protein n=1 Tax=Lentzea sp. CA-135723 TaxID=3239950 RepID=UPI003D947C07
MTGRAERSARPQHPAAGSGPPIACGYLRRGEGKRVSVPQLQQRIMAHARELGFALYHPIFVDTVPGSPLQRNAFRVLLDVVWELHITTLITPSLWHLSQDDAEARQARRRLTSYGCDVIFMR